MPVGTWNTSQLPADLAKKSFAAAITRLMPNGGAPLFGISALLKEDTAMQIEHGYFSARRWCSRLSSVCASSGC
jgi:hypothetical protein